MGPTSISEQAPPLFEDEERKDFEFMVFSQRGGWPQRNEKGEYKKRSTQQQWLEWLKDRPGT